MKYGILFSMLSLLLAVRSLTLGGWFLLMLWPAISVGIVGVGYLGVGHRIFGKRSDGSMAVISVAILLPYLLCLWMSWHVIRLVSVEPAHHVLANGVIIGRRLLSSELPTDIATIVDLTAEFPAPHALRYVDKYIAAPMLDASALPPETLAYLATQITCEAKPVYIHCAQGHGRTGLVAALVVIVLGQADTAETALQKVQQSRPKVRLNKTQFVALREASLLIRSR